MRIGVANQRTVMRTLELPPLFDRKELDAAVRFQAEDQVPMPLAGAVIDFHPLGCRRHARGRAPARVRRGRPARHDRTLLAAVRDAGLRPEGVDLSAFALIRSLYPADASEVQRRGG